MTSVLIVDSNLLARFGLKQMLTHEYRGILLAAAKGDVEALTLLAKRPWDIVILDISPPFQNAFQLLGALREQCPSVRVLVMSSQAHALHAARSQKMGATGYTNKDASRADFLRAFRNVLSGKQHFDEFPFPYTGDGMGTRLARLSPREYRVMLALGDGKRASDIASELNLSIKTVSTYKRRVLDKLHLKSVAELVRHVIDQKLS